MSIVTGLVQAKSKTKFGYGILVADKWYNSKYDIRCDKGDTVEFEDGGRNYCNKLKVTGRAEFEAPSAPSESAALSDASKPSINNHRTIIRQNALSHATAIAIANKKTKAITPEEVIALARTLEGYSSGDDDMAEAEALLADAAIPDLTDVA